MQGCNPPHEQAAVGRHLLCAGHGHATVVPRTYYSCVLTMLPSADTSMLVTGPGIPSITQEAFSSCVARAWQVQSV